MTHGFRTPRVFFERGKKAWRIIPGLGYVVNNHGDRFRPLKKTGLFPLQMADIYGANKWGLDPNHFPKSWEPIPQSCGTLQLGSSTPKGCGLEPRTPIRVGLRLQLNTPNWNTPLLSNFYQQAISRDSFHNWLL